MHHDAVIYLQRSMTLCHYWEIIFCCIICNIKIDYEKGESKFRGQIWQFINPLHYILKKIYRKFTVVYLMKVRIWQMLCVLESGLRKSWEICIVQYCREKGEIVILLFKPWVKIWMLRLKNKVLAFEHYCCCSKYLFWSSINDICYLFVNCWL